MVNYWNPTNWDNGIPDFIIHEIYSHFFDQNGKPILTYSQYHKETMWEHVCSVYENFCKNWAAYRDDLSSFWMIGVWSALLHDIAKPNTIVEKYRKICSNCNRPNVPVLKEKIVRNCFACKSEDLQATSDKWQKCNDCGKYLPFKLEEKENTNCYICKAQLPQESVLQHGWHGHDELGGSRDFLDIYLNKIQGLSEEEKNDITKIVRYHSLVHALMHREFQSSRANAEANKQHSMHRSDFKDLGFNPFEKAFEEALTLLLGNRNLAIVAVLLSASDDQGKISDIEEERFTLDFINSLILRLKV